jgi:hypothetical protein
MKKFFYSFAVIGLMSMTACTNSDDILADVATEAGTGEEVEVSFTVDVPEGISARSWDDGTAATLLRYEIYDANGAAVNGTYSPTTTIETPEASLPTISSKKVTVTATLLKGYTYSYFFWASPAESPYKINYTDKTVTVSYDDATANDNNRGEVFYASNEAFKVAGDGSTTSTSITLKRAVAKVEVGTGAKDFAAAIGYSYFGKWIATSYMGQYVYTDFKVKGVYTTFDLMKGDVTDDSLVENEVAFAPASCLNANNVYAQTNVNGTAYYAISNNYFFVKEGTVDCSVSFGDENHENVMGTINMYSIPVKRNNKTLVYGDALFTNSVDFKISVSPYFSPINGTSEAMSDHDTAPSVDENTDATDGGQN